MGKRFCSLGARIFSAWMAVVMASAPLNACVPAALADRPPDHTPSAVGRGAPSRDASPTIVRELAENRSQSGRQFLLSDGSIEAQYYGAPVNFRDPRSGAFAPIDSSMHHESRGGRGRSVNGANSVRIELPDELAGDWVSAETSAARVALRPSRRGAEPVVAASGEGVRARSVSSTGRAYDDAFAGADLEYESRGDGLKETIVVSEPSSTTVYSFDLAVTGGVPRLRDDGSIAIMRSGESTPALSIPAPCMWDSAETTLGAGFSAGVRYGLSGSGPVWRLDVVPDPAWLWSPERVYPVRIDPGVIAVAGTPQDTFVSSAYPTTNYSGHQLTWVNTNDPSANWTEYGLLQLGTDVASDMAARTAGGYRVSSGTLSLVMYQAARAGYVWGSRCTDDVGITSVTWNTRPSTTTGQGTPTVPTCANGAHNDLDITDMLAFWQDSANQNCTVRLSGTAGTHVGYESAERTNRPVVTVNYAGTPQVTLVSPEYGTQPEGAPSARWSYADPLTGNPQVEYAVAVTDGDTGELLATSGGQGSATTVGLPVPAGGWAVGRAYGVSVSAASEPAAGRARVWSEPADGGFTLVLPSAVTSVSAETTASAREFAEADTDGDGRNDRANDSADSGRGSVCLRWDAAQAATGYDIYLSDGFAYRKVGSTEATSWSSAGRGFFPTDSAIAGLSDGATGNPFVSAGGFDLRDDPRPLYAKTAGDALDGQTAYSFRVVPRNGNGSLQPTECAECLVVLDDRTAHVGGAGSHTEFSLGTLNGDEAAFVMDRGSLRLTATDLALPSIGPDIEVSRSYDSSVTGAGMFAPGWRFSFEACVNAGAGWAEAIDETGERTRFARQGSGWLAPDGCFDTLAGDAAAGWTFTHKDGSVQRFDASGRLVAETDANGNAVAFDWTPTALTIRAPGDVWLLHERRIVVEFGSDGRVTRAVLHTPSGDRTVEYGFANDEATVRSCPGTDAQRTSVYRYSGTRVSAIVAPGFEPSANHEAVWRVSYGSQGTTMAVFNDSGAGAPAMRREASWDAASRTGAVVSAVASRTLAWDSRGHETARSEENASAGFSAVYDAAGNRIRERTATGALTRSRFDARGNLVWQADASGTESEFRYSRDRCVWERDGRGSETSRTFDACGNLLTEDKTLDEGGAVAHSEYSYHAAPWAGELKREYVQVDSSTDAITDYADYDECGSARQVTQKAVRLDYATGAKDLVTRRTFDGFGGLLTQVDPLGAQTIANRYDAAGRTTRATDASGTSAETAYGVLGEVTETKRSDPSTSAVADWTRRTYNGCGLLVRETALASDGTTVSATTHSYDAAGRETATDDSLAPGKAAVVYDRNGNSAVRWDEGADTSNTLAAARSAFDAEGRVTSETAPGASGASLLSKYDETGRVIAETRPDGSATAYMYAPSGDLVAQSSPTEAGNANTRFGFDLAGRATMQADPAGAVTTTKYDLIGNLTSSTRDGQASTRDTRNALGWVIRSLDFDGLDTRVTLDGAGRPLTEAVVGGSTTARKYDATGRVISQTNPDGSCVQSAYDVFGRLVLERHVSATGIELARITTAYDAAGRMIRRGDSVAGITRDVAYSAGGTMTVTETRRAGSAVSRSTVDGTGLLRAVEATFAGGRVDWSLAATDAAGRVTNGTSKTLANNWSARFDEAGRLSRSAEQTGTAPRAAYSYSPTTGRKTHESLRFKIHGAEETTYTYTLTGRLASASTNGVTTRFDYDPLTGALCETRRGFEPSATIYLDHYGRPKGSGSSSWTYDSLGRRTSAMTPADGWLTYKWAGDRLQSVASLWGWSASHTYNAEGQRSRSVVTSYGVATTTTWNYDGQRLLGYSATSSNGATWSVDFMSGPDGKPIAGVYRANDCAATPFLLETTDRGDVRELLDASGRAFAYYEYDAYGRPTETIVSVTPSIGAAQAAKIASRQVLRYAGYVWDVESGLYYLSQRYYDPKVAAFISRDPARADGEESAHQYCGGDPVGKTDPSGLDSTAVGPYGAAWLNRQYRFACGRYEIPSSLPSGRPGSKGSAAMGLRPEFARALFAMIDDAKGATGHRAKVTDGWRSYQLQVTTRKKKGSLAAIPGRSLHGWGIAADLDFRSNSTKRWMHKNVSAYGLRFLGALGQSEDWHVQARYTRTGVDKAVYHD